MSKRVQLRLLASRGMSDKGEDVLIRFPKKAREYLEFVNDLVVLGKGKYQTTLQVKKAYKEDLKNLASLLQKGTLSDAEAASVGFVSQATFKRINGQEGSLWVSDGVGNITIGADPEFGLIDNEGILQRGNQVIPHMGRFGSDGPSAEVRPAPDTDHLMVVKRIEEILKNPPKATERYQWLGGATYKDPTRVYWFGGHIHLGRPSSIGPGVATGVYHRIAVVLDALLALPMCRFDTPEPFQRRNGCTLRYGCAGDIRSDYPEQDRFEYRVLSGLWLVHPTLAKIAMGTAKCITETAYGRLADAKFDFDWATAPTSRRSLVGSFKLKNLRKTQGIINRALPGEVTEEVVQAWKTQLKQLDLFDEYSAELNALMALTDAAPTEFSLNIRDNWYNNKPLLAKPKSDLRRALAAVEEK